MKPILAHTYAGTDPTGWLLSEKLDGVRALWDGSRLLSRNGNAFPAPQGFLDSLPAVPLDGELWIARGAFQETLSAVKRGDFSRIRFLVFDAPSHPGTFQDRFMAAWIAIESSPVCQIVGHTYCSGRESLENHFRHIISQGGEGVMLRDPAGLYVAGRSHGLLKYKPHEDAEGVLVDTEPGTGQFAGQCGALVLQWGARLVRIGSGLTNAMRENPPALGESITFRFRGLTDSGAPRFPTFLTVRNYE